MFGLRRFWLGSLRRWLVVLLLFRIFSLRLLNGLFGIFILGFVILLFFGVLRKWLWLILLYVLRFIVLLIFLFWVYWLRLFLIFWLLSLILNFLLFNCNKSFVKSGFLSFVRLFVWFMKIFLLVIWLWFLFVRCLCCLFIWFGIILWRSFGLLSFLMRKFCCCFWICFE